MKVLCPVRTIVCKRGSVQTVYFNLKCVTFPYHEGGTAAVYRAAKLLSLGYPACPCACTLASIFGASQPDKVNKMIGNAVFNIEIWRLGRRSLRRQIPKLLVAMCHKVEKNIVWENEKRYFLPNDVLTSLLLGTLIWQNIIDPVTVHIRSDNSPKSEGESDSGQKDPCVNVTTSVYDEIGQLFLRIYQTSGTDENARKCVNIFLKDFCLDVWLKTGIYSTDPKSPDYKDVKTFVKEVASTIVAVVVGARGLSLQKSSKSQPFVTSLPLLSVGQMLALIRHGKFRYCSFSSKKEEQFVENRPALYASLDVVKDDKTLSLRGLHTLKKIADLPEEERQSKITHLLAALERWRNYAKKEEQ